jgi:hypothetical protein
LKLGLSLSTIVLAGALTVSGALAEEAVPAAKESAPAAKETTTTSPSAHALPHESLPAGGSANSARGSPAEGSAPSKGTADNAGAKGKAGGTSPGVGREKAGSGPTSSAKESGTGANPIDTRITVQTPRVIKKPPLANEKKMSAPAALPSANSSRQIIPRDMSGSARNAIGVPLDDHARAKGVSSGPQGSPPAAAASAGKNVMGAPGSNVSANAATTVHPSSSPVIAGSTPPNRSVITGSGMSRPGYGSGTLGGAAKNAAAINGTSIRPKQ